MKTGQTGCILYSKCLVRQFIWILFNGLHRFLLYISYNIRRKKAHARQYIFHKIRAMHLLDIVALRLIQKTSRIYANRLGKTELYCRISNLTINTLAVYEFSKIKEKSLSNKHWRSVFSMPIKIHRYILRIRCIFRIKSKLQFLQAFHCFPGEYS